ncbi:putative Lecithin:cholesterol acyltransferase [Monocercomonoides exilis]|uniref:putative Lecithin:cholesterol acyltransferase n=1 Tax=Monocercomonoides exilis TaxID=2049356 RepID=UPI003559489F|nr:putative Lecithin:cholesterol acyltransferase [Monocercomonoides exilis]|eukprot:MONOS_14536.1-p1 / transcript=MONOS_14536.1 / gene=MONOS_14536 / organism=Monocercomonoides_exilis_PA203 / gene_product=unspecified product / transcript_product=unspecified product / location=Mono_scaffold01020:999-3915(-) / protein_length=778 / sequence_SO=supercontig / SO=protein_coding / is_pseudo=false
MEIISSDIIIPFVSSKYAKDWIVNYDEMQKEYQNKGNIEVRPLGYGTTDGIDFLFPWFYGSTVFGMMNDFFEKHGYERGVNLFGAPYDFRTFSVDGCMKNNRSTHPFSMLKSLIEEVHMKSGRKVHLLGHSLGGNIIYRFITQEKWREELKKMNAKKLASVNNSSRNADTREHEEDECNGDGYVDEEWVKNHIESFISLSTPFGGSLHSLLLMFASPLEMGGREEKKELLKEDKVFLGLSEKKDGKQNRFEHSSDYSSMDRFERNVCPRHMKDRWEKRDIYQCLKQHKEGCEKLQIKKKMSWLNKSRWNDCAHFSMHPKNSSREFANNQINYDSNDSKIVYEQIDDFEHPCIHLHYESIASKFDPQYNNLQSGTEHFVNLGMSYKSDVSLDSKVNSSKQRNKKMDEQNSVTVLNYSTSYESKRTNDLVKPSVAFENLVWSFFPDWDREMISAIYKMLLSSTASVENSESAEERKKEHVKHSVKERSNSGTYENLNSESASNSSKLFKISSHLHSKLLRDKVEEKNKEIQSFTKQNEDSDKHKIELKNGNYTCLKPFITKDELHKMIQSLGALMMLVPVSPPYSDNTPIFSIDDSYYSLSNISLAFNLRNLSSLLSSYSHHYPPLSVFPTPPISSHFIYSSNVSTLSRFALYTENPFSTSRFHPNEMPKNTSSPAPFTNVIIEKGDDGDGTVALKSLLDIPRQWIEQNEKNRKLNFDRDERKLDILKVKHATKNASIEHSHLSSQSFSLHHFPYLSHTSILFEQKVWETILNITSHAQI